MKLINVFPTFLLMFCPLLINSQTISDNGRDPYSLPESILPARNIPSLQNQTEFLSDKDIFPIDKYLVSEDLIVKGSLAVGDGTPTTPTFGFNTILLTENNLRIRFDDNSTGSFPSNDWTLVANETGSGGANFFAIEDATAGIIPFKVMAGAPANSIYIRDNGNVGFNTDNPIKTLHTKAGDSPSLRLEQDGGGWPTQT